MYTQLKPIFLAERQRSYNVKPAGKLTYLQVLLH